MSNRYPNGARMRRCRFLPVSVYVFSAPNGLQKIGISNDPELRLMAFDDIDGKPVLLTAEYTRPRWEMADARVVERAAHTLVGNHRFAGEWFKVTPEEAASAVERALEMWDRGEIKRPDPGWSRGGSAWEMVKGYAP